MQNGQIILACDDSGNFLEYISKEVGHTGKGKRHFAISVFVYNSNGEVLLQKRKHQVFDDIWDMTASTHQLRREDGTNETDEEATIRALKREYNINPEKLKNLHKVGTINYFAQYGNYCENEHDIILIAEYNDEINLNLEVGYEYKWMRKKEFVQDIENNPKTYTPWTYECLNLLKEVGFF